MGVTILLGSKMRAAADVIIEKGWRTEAIPWPEVRRGIARHEGDSPGRLEPNAWVFPSEKLQTPLSRDNCRSGYVACLLNELD